MKPLSTAKEIEKNYKKLAKKYHSDTGGNEEKMKEINKAYNILKDYIKNFKFTFSEDEIKKQYPEEFHKNFKVFE
ncbi:MULTISPECIES: J domain-containing protein [unclassified Lebetimonas]|uniref:J domain-containing protein n=1 Tax=unclassified Lebetimonas TaxID=2648158 RepID=UPI002100FC2A|nr:MULTISPECIES: DnaJ domain-containing protein [unclassified Lebetimonas]